MGDMYDDLRSDEQMIEHDKRASLLEETDVHVFEYTPANTHLVWSGAVYNLGKDAERIKEEIKKALLNL